MCRRCTRQQQQVILDESNWFLPVNIHLRIFCPLKEGSLSTGWCKDVKLTVPSTDLSGLATHSCQLGTNEPNLQLQLSVLYPQPAQCRICLCCVAGARQHCCLEGGHLGGAWVPAQTKQHSETVRWGTATEIARAAVWGDQLEEVGHLSATKVVSRVQSSLPVCGRHCTVHA